MGTSDAVYRTRNRRLHQLVLKFGQAEICRRVTARDSTRKPLGFSQLGQWLSEVRNMSETSARRIEDAFKLPPRWLDEDFAELPPEVASSRSQLPHHFEGPIIPTLGSIDQALVVLRQHILDLDEDGRNTVALLLADWAKDPMRKKASAATLVTLLGPKMSDEDVANHIDPAPVHKAAKPK